MDVPRPRVAGRRAPLTTTDSQPRGTRALVAAGHSPEGLDRTPGELVLIPEACGRSDCSCAWMLAGATSRGRTDVARVVLLSGTGRATVREALGEAMRPHCCSPAAAGAEADRLLAVAATHAVGTLLRRERGRILAIPPGRTTPTGVVSPARSVR